MDIEFNCPDCRQHLSVDASAAGRSVECPACGTTLAVPHRQGDATGGLIPYKNGPALTAYYLGVFSLIPCIGLPLGIAAFVLGVLGLKKARAHPEVKGEAHAWTGIVLGGLSALVYGSMTLFVLFMVLSHA